jgi:hypothetical protein
MNTGHQENDLFLFLSKEMQSNDSDLVRLLREPFFLFLFLTGFNEQLACPHQKRITNCCTTPCSSAQQ